MLEYISERWPNTPLAVMGHSMGGFTAVGAWSLFKEFKTAVVMNGSGWWEESERRFRSSLHIEKPRSYRFLQMQFAAMDPYQHMDRLSGRSLLSLRGGADDVVDGAAQELYLEKLATHRDVKSQSVSTTLRPLRHDQYDGRCCFLAQSGTEGITKSYGTQNNNRIDADASLRILSDGAGRISSLLLLFFSAFSVPALTGAIGNFYDKMT